MRGAVPPANGILAPANQRIVGDEKQLACPVGGAWPSKCGDADVEPAIAVRASHGGEPRKPPCRGRSNSPTAGIARCSPALLPVAGMRINSGCPGGFQVVGDIDRSQPGWRVFFQGEKSIALEPVDVAVAWF
jgi:hypothetical protein